MPAPIVEGAEHAVVAAASYFRGRFGPLSQPLLCRIIGPSTSPSRARRLSQGRRSPSNPIEIVEVSGTAVGTLSLAWEAPSHIPTGLKWTVVLEPGSGTLQGHSMRAQDLVECRASFTGLAPSTTYFFRISPVLPEVDQEPLAAVTIPAASVTAGGHSLAVTGTRFVPSSTRTVPPASSEGVVALPPFDHEALYHLKRDPQLRPLVQLGVFARLSSKPFGH